MYKEDEDLREAVNEYNKKLWSDYFDYSYISDIFII